MAVLRRLMYTPFFILCMLAISTSVVVVIDLPPRVPTWCHRAVAIKDCVRHVAFLLTVFKETPRVYTR